MPELPLAVLDFGIWGVAAQKSNFSKLLLSSQIWVMADFRSVFWFDFIPGTMRAQIRDSHGAQMYCRIKLFMFPRQLVKRGLACPLPWSCQNGSFSLQRCKHGAHFGSVLTIWEENSKLEIFEYALDFEQNIFLGCWNYVCIICVYYKDLQGINIACLLS